MNLKVCNFFIAFSIKLRKFTSLEASQKGRMFRETSLVKLSVSLRKNKLSPRRIRPVEGFLF